MLRLSTVLFPNRLHQSRVVMSGDWVGCTLRYFAISELVRGTPRRSRRGGQYSAAGIAGTIV